MPLKKAKPTEKTEQHFLSHPQTERASSVGTHNCKRVCCLLYNSEKRFLFKYLKHTSSHCSCEAFSPHHKPHFGLCNQIILYTWASLELTVHGYRKLEEITFVLKYIRNTLMIAICGLCFSEKIMQPRPLTL